MLKFNYHTHVLTATNYAQIYAGIIYVSLPSQGGIHIYDSWLFCVGQKFIYPIIICDIDLSSFLKQVFQYINAVSSFNCHMQGGHLMDRKKM